MTLMLIVHSAHIKSKILEGYSPPKGRTPQSHFSTNAASSFNTPDNCPHSFS